MSWITKKFKVGDEVEVPHGDNSINNRWWGSQGVVTYVSDWAVGVVWHSGYGRQWHTDTGISRADHSTSAHGIKVIDTRITIPEPLDDDLI